MAERKSCVLVPLHVTGLGSRGRHSLAALIRVRECSGGWGVAKDKKDNVVLFTMHVNPVCFHFPLKKNIFLVFLPLAASPSGCHLYTGLELFY